MPEVVITDLFLGHPIKLVLNLTASILMLLLLRNYISFSFEDKILFFLIAILSSISYINFGSQMTFLSFFHLSKNLLFIKILEGVLNKNSHDEWRYKLTLLLWLPVFSFILYSIKPLVLYSFNDNSGHLMNLTYLSLSSSIYQIGNLHFARMSFVFAEPGTYAIFLILMTGIFFSLGKSFSKELMLGLASISLAYIVYCLSLVLLNTIKTFRFSKSYKNKYWLLAVTLTPILFITIQSDTSDIFFQYLSDRFLSVFGENNRSSGNTAALLSILDSPAGLPFNDYSNRSFTSSGIIVITAYFGLLCGPLFLYILYKGVRQFKSYSYLILGIIFISLNRNDLFTGFSIQFFYLIPLIFLRKSTTVV